MLHLAEKLYTLQKFFLIEILEPKANQKKVPQQTAKDKSSESDGKIQFSKKKINFFSEEYNSRNQLIN